MLLGSVGGGALPSAQQQRAQSQAGASPCHHSSPPQLRRARAAQLLQPQQAHGSTSRRQRRSTATRAVAAEVPTMETVEVDLGDRTYPIHIGVGLLDRGELLRAHIQGKRALIVTNETVAPLYLDRRVRGLS